MSDFYVEAFNIGNITKRIKEMRKVKGVPPRRKMMSVSPRKRFDGFMRKEIKDNFSELVGKVSLRHSPTKRGVSKENITVGYDENLFRAGSPTPSIFSSKERPRIYCNKRKERRRYNDSEGNDRTQGQRPSIFTFDVFGDLSLPKKKVSRR